ncbi:MAG: ankyrin-3-like [Rickettsiaceae bacterium]|nr:ankyrin-3-like [Rickettsiaceae bacterium]
MITSDEELINSIKANNIQAVIAWVENGGDPFKAIKIKKMIVQNEDLAVYDGNKINDVDREETMTVLDYINNLNAEQLLIEVVRRAKPNSTLVWAAIKDKSNLFKLCLHLGADINKAVIYLAKFNKENAFKQLLNLGIDKQLILNEALKQNLFNLIKCLVSNIEDMQNVLVYWFNNNDNNKIKIISEIKPILFCEALYKLLLDGIITKQDDIDKIFKLLPNNVFIKNFFSNKTCANDLLNNAAQSKNISLFKYFIESNFFDVHTLIAAALKAKHKEIYKLFISSSYEKDLLSELIKEKDMCDDLKYLMEKGCNVNFIFSQINYFEKRTKEFNNLLKFAKEKNLIDKINFSNFLFDAVYYSMKSVINKCKNAGVDLNKILNDKGDNLLKYALNGIKNPTLTAKIKIIKNLINNDVRFDTVNISNESVMSFLIDGMQKEYIKLLLNNQINLNLYNVKESEPLKPINYIIRNIEIKPELFKLIDLFIKHGANINDFDEHKMTPLMYALEVKDQTLGLNVVNKLLEKGLKVENTNELKAALLKAIDTGYDNVAIYLLDKGIDPNSHDEKGCALKRAEGGALGLINKLIEKGADFVKAFGNEKGLLDINYIIRNVEKKPELFKLMDLFIMHGANINDFDEHKMTPLMYALEIKDQTLGINVVNKLFANGLKIENTDEIKAAFFKAIDTGFSVVAFYLLDKGIDPNSHDGNSYALKRAEERSLNLINKLIEKGADFVKAFGNEKGLLDINYIIKNVEKKPVLLRLMDLFIKHGANINDFDEHKMTPLMYTLEIKDGRLVRGLINILCANGLKIENTDEIKAAFLKAIDTGYHNIACFLLDRGIDPNSYDEKGYALNRIKGGATYLTNKLIEKGADPVKAFGDEKGLFFFIENSNLFSHVTGIVDKLIESNVNFNIEKKCNIEGKETIVTPLALVMSKGNFGLFKKIFLLGRIDANQLKHYSNSLNLLDNFKELKEFADIVNGFIRINPLNQIEIEKFYSVLIKNWGFCFKSFLARSIQKGIIINDRGDELSKLIIKFINSFGTLANFSIEKYKEHILNSLNKLKMYIFKSNVEIQDHYKNVIDAVEKQLTSNIDQIEKETKDLELHLVSLFDPEFLEIIKDNSKGPNEPSWSITTHPTNSILGLIGKREYNSDKSEHNGGEVLGEGRILRKFLDKILAQDVDINIRLAFADITSLDDLKNNYIDKIKSLFPDGYFVAFVKFYLEIQRFLKDPLHGFLQDLYAENQEHKKIIEEKDAKIKELEEQLKKYADFASSNKRKEPDVIDEEEVQNKKLKQDDSSNDLADNEAPLAEEINENSVSEVAPNNMQTDSLEASTLYSVNISGAFAEMNPN